MGVGADEAKAANLNGVLASVVESVQADSGTVHFLGEDGLLHLAAATAGMPTGCSPPLRLFRSARAWRAWRCSAAAGNVMETGRGRRRGVVSLRSRPQRSQSAMLVPPRP
jgi:hypothetical protein